MSHRLIKDYIEKSSWRIKENSNFNYSFSGLLSYIANNTLARYGLSILPKDVAKAHNDGWVHLHNMEGGCLLGYCHGANLLSILTKGLFTKSVVTKPAKHMSAAVDHLANYFMISQLEWSGAQSASDVDTLLAPFVHYDKLSYKEVKQNIQRLVFNLNFTSRNSYQSPFTNLSFNLICPKPLREMPALIGGKPTNDTYADFQDESDMINMAFTEVYRERDGAGNPFTFPIPTINVTKSFDWDSDVVRNIFLTQSVMGNYYFFNFIGSGFDEYTIRSMCCRLNLDISKLKMPKGLFYAGGGTGSLGVSTINLPRLGYVSKNEDELLEKLEWLLGVCRRYQLFKRERIIESLKNNLLPFSAFYDLNPDNYFMTVGLLGINEMCLNFTGNDITSNVSLVKRVIQHASTLLDEFAKVDDKLYNLELVPAEGSSYRLAFIDKKRYKNIQTLGIEGKPYYTSLVVPPQLGLGIPEQVKIEEEILPLFTGGTVSRIFFGEHVEHTSLINFAKKMMNTKIPYQDYSNTFSICKREGKYLDGIQDKCPECGGRTTVFARVVGYYRPVDRFNLGKHQEFLERKYVNI